MLRQGISTRAVAHLILCAALFAVPVRAHGVGYQNWAVLYGGSGAEEMEGIRQTADGGTIIVGSTDSYGDVVNGDAWIVKLDRYGNAQWQKTYGGLKDESAIDVKQTADGGYIVAGWTQSFGVSKTDVWVFKLSAAGAVEWERSYGGSGEEQAWSVEVTSDGHYLVAGGTTSFGAGRSDYWVLKLDTGGNIVWQRTYGGPRNDGGAGSYPEYVVRALEDADGNYVVASESYSFGAGVSDIWVLKLDSSGNILWQKAYGGSDEDSMWSFAVTSDGNYLVPGSTVSFSPDYSGDMWVLKLDKTGGILWQKVYGVPNDWDEVLSVAATTDGGGLIGGYVEQGTTDWDLLLLRLDASGNSLWQRTYEYGWDWPNAIQQTSDGGFAVAGVGWPVPQDLELWVLKTGSDGLIGSSCSAIKALTLTQGVTHATVTASNGVSQATGVMPQATNAIVQDSTAVANFMCQGQPAEDCGNGVDDDGDGLIDCNDPDCQGDADGDGYVAVPCGTDCDDTDPAVNPAATEICTNVKDDNCDGSADCSDTQCVSLPICTLPTRYGRGHSVTGFNLRRTGHDRATMKLCVTQAFCDTVAGMVGDAAKTLTVTVDGCPDVVMAGGGLTANRANTVFKVKSARGQVPGYLVKVNCRRLQALVRLKYSDLQTCVTNPVGTTLAADGARSLRADGTFSELRDRNGNVRRLVLKSSTLCN